MAAIIVNRSHANKSLLGEDVSSQYRGAWGTRRARLADTTGQHRAARSTTNCICTSVRLCIYTFVRSIILFGLIGQERTLAVSYSARETDPRPLPANARLLARYSNNLEPHADRDQPPINQPADKLAE